jgi:hypothetical protein
MASLFCGGASVSLSIHFWCPVLARCLLVMVVTLRLCVNASPEGAAAVLGYQDLSGNTMMINNEVVENLVIDFDRRNRYHPSLVDSNADTTASDHSASSAGPPLVYRPGVIMLGMHRSGTSLLCGLLAQMGFRFGGPLFGANDENKLGYFERVDVVHQNNQFLETQQLSHSNSTHLYQHHISLSHYEQLKNTNWFHGGRSAMLFFNYRGDRSSREKVHDIDYAPYLAKDPRFCITLNTWLSLIDGPDNAHSNAISYNALPAILFIYRHPLDVAASLVKRKYTGVTVAKGLKLWYVYNLNAIQQSYDLCRVIVSHKRLLQQPKLELERIYHELLHDCGVGVRRRGQDGFAVNFVDLSLVHSQVGSEEQACDLIRRSKTRGSVPSEVVPDANAWKTSSSDDLALYRSCMRLYCAFEDRSAFVPGFAWDYSIRD